VAPNEKKLLSMMNGWKFFYVQIISFIVLNLSLQEFLSLFRIH